MHTLTSWENLKKEIRKASSSSLRSHLWLETSRNRIPYNILVLTNKKIYCLCITLRPLKRLLLKSKFALLSWEKMQIPKIMIKLDKSLRPASSWSNTVREIESYVILLPLSTQSMINRNYLLELFNNRLLRVWISLNILTKHTTKWQTIKKDKVTWVIDQEKNRKNYNRIAADSKSMIPLRKTYISAYLPIQRSRPKRMHLNRSITLNRLN